HFAPLQSLDDSLSGAVNLSRDAASRLPTEIGLQSFPLRSTRSTPSGKTIYAYVSTRKVPSFLLSITCCNHQPNNPSSDSITFLILLTLYPSDTLASKTQRCTQAFLFCTQRK